MNVPSDPADFIFVDTAFGGVNQRNRVRRLDEVRLNGQPDCYVSHNRATVSLLEWRNNHKNETGKPTIAGFTGPTWADNLHLDYDCEADPGQALVWCRRGLDWLEAHGVELRAIKVYFSGYKGFGVEIPHTLFGGFVPSEDLHRRLRRAAGAILQGIPFDTSIYDKLRLWRLPNTRHGKSGLFKVRLTIAEVRTLSIDEIKALAAAPRDELVVSDLAPIADDEWSPSETLVEIWDATAVPESKSADETGERQAPTDTARDRQTIAAIATSWPYGGRNDVEGEGAVVSRHADYLMPIVGFLAARASAEHVIELVAAAAEQANDRTFVAGRDWRGEIKRMAESAVGRIGNGEEVKGLPSLAKTAPALACVLEALWPGPVFTIGAETGGEGAASTADENAYRTHSLLAMLDLTVSEKPWLVDQLVMAGRTTWLFSEPSTGKTLLVLALLLHIAAGRPFHGRAVRQGAVILIEEDSALSVVREYLEMLLDIYEMDPAELPFQVNTLQGLRLTGLDGVKIIQDVVARCPQRPVAIAFDACERLVPSDRFTSRELDPLIKLFAWCVSEGIAPIMIDHTNKETLKRGEKPASPMNRLYGARAKSAVSDVMLYLHGGIAKEAHLSFVKFRGDAPPGCTISFDQATGFSVRSDPSAAKTPNEQVVLKFFNNAPPDWYRFTEIERATGQRRRTLQRVLKTLSERGVLLAQGETNDRVYRRNPAAPGPFG